MIRNVLLLFVATISGITSWSQQPGFDAREYEQMLYISARTVADSSYSAQHPVPVGYSLQYQSATLALDNLWQLWLDEKGETAILSIRGTTANPISWFENFYAAMVPAKGFVKISDVDTFHYHLSDHPQAAVHVGWTIGMAHIANDALPRLQQLISNGVKGVIVVGHSQGGAIAYLLTSQLQYWRRSGILPSSLIIKTYCSASPKPGNLYYAYSFEHETAAGWSYNVVNAADWVPETPISIQTTDDFNKINPFVLAPKAINQQSLSNRLALTYVYKKLDKPTKKARSNYIKFLGYAVEEKAVKPQLPYLNRPKYFQSNNYVRTGTTIVLMPDSEYFKMYGNDDSNQIFIHHFHLPYIYLLRRQFQLK
jgi:pimeloyl-ACP methyl ester carboxylesterase